VGVLHDTNDESRASRFCVDPVAAGEIGIEEMPPRCAAHDQWMLAHPAATAFSKAWADRTMTPFGPASHASSSP
jgi:hypothetical protein